MLTRGATLHLLATCVAHLARTCPFLSRECTTFYWANMVQLGAWLSCAPNTGSKLWLRHEAAADVEAVAWADMTADQRAEQNANKTVEVDMSRFEITVHNKLIGETIAKLPDTIYRDCDRFIRRVGEITLADALFRVFKKFKILNVKDRLSIINALVPESPKEPIDTHEVISRLVDNSDFMEVQPDFAGNVLIGFARIGGIVVGIIANQSMVKAGTLDIDASDKAARFINFLDCFNIPIVTLVDGKSVSPKR